MKTIEIDKDSGFCFGVVNAIRKAEEELNCDKTLYCLGDIVHNSREVDRLCKKGLVTIDHNDLKRLHHTKILLRAHGEPPETYKIARENNIEIIDATCPVVLQLQKKIKAHYDPSDEETQIVIYGKNGHAEVNGLVGQTAGKAIVVESVNDLDKIDFHKHIKLFSQTTKSLHGFKNIVEQIKSRIDTNATFVYYDTICRKVANRMPHIRNFAMNHELTLFVCGQKSSNGKMLFEECKKVNMHAHMISDKHDVNIEWIKPVKSIGICGATSTPYWLMEEIAQYIRNLIEQNNLNCNNQ